MRSEQSGVSKRAELPPKQTIRAVVPSFEPWLVTWWGFIIKKKSNLAFPACWETATARNERRTAAASMVASCGARGRLVSGELIQLALGQLNVAHQGGAAATAGQI